MLFAFLLLVLAAGATAFEKCGTKNPTPEQMRDARAMQQREEAARAHGSSLVSTSGIEINLYYHILYDSAQDDDSHLNLAVLERQTKVLNDAYRPHNISFKQAGATTVVDFAGWSLNQEELVMKRHLRQGTYADLNVYIFPFIDFLDGYDVSYMGILGYSRFPEIIPAVDRDDYEESIFINDGISMRSATLPSIRDWEFGLGMTLVHEAGHWLNLQHTFAGGCYGGDGIDDTPAEESSSFGCNLHRDTCPYQPGNDPVTNYMDYSDDSCLDEFTPGQEIRMYAAWKELRAPHQSQSI